VAAGKEAKHLAVVKVEGQARGAAAEHVVRHCGLALERLCGLAKRGKLRQRHDRGTLPTQGFCLDRTCLRFQGAPGRLLGTSAASSRPNLQPQKARPYCAKRSPSLAAPPPEGELLGKWPGERLAFPRPRMAITEVDFNFLIFPPSRL